MNVSMMNCKMKEKIKIEIEIGHWAKRLSATPMQSVLPTSSVPNATHVWKVWVCGRRGQLESFVERVVFQLHPTFPNPTRVVSRPPFEIEEKAFGTFPMKIELHFNDSMAAFEYEVFLMLDKDINCKSIKSFAIANPRPPEFREKLIRAGGVVVDPSEESPLAPTDVKLTKSSKQPGGGASGSLVRHRSKSKGAAASGLLAPDDHSLFASPASSTDELPQAGQPAPGFPGSLTQSPPQQLAAVPAGGSSSGSGGCRNSIVGSRLASPSKAKLRESGSSRPSKTQPASPAAAVVKPEPVVSGFEADLPQPQQQQTVPPVPRVAELRSDEIKSEKLVLKISKSPIKSSPAAVQPMAIKTEATAVPAVPLLDSYRPEQLANQQQSWLSPPTTAAAAPAMVAVVTPHVAVDNFKSSPPSVVPPQQPPPPPATYSEPLSVPASWQSGGGGGGGVTTESDEDRRKRKKEKRKKDKQHRHHHHHRPRSQHDDQRQQDGSGADSDGSGDSDRKRHERRRHRHEGKEKKRRRRDEEHNGDAQAAAPAAAAQLPPYGDSGGIHAEASQTPTAAPPPHQQQQQPPSQPPQPPPMLEAEPPMLSPYLQSAAPKEDPELMSQTSIESTGFRPAAAERASSSADSSPLAVASIPISAAAMAAESSALARHPKYQWSAQSGLSREEYDQRFHLCLLAASLEDPDRLQLLASVLAESEALTNRDANYANFDLARLRPDCVKRLVALLMPDSAS